MTTPTALPAPPAPTDRCSQCGALFVCGYAAGLGDCWCASLPKLPAGEIVPGQPCLCPACLGARATVANPPVP